MNSGIKKELILEGLCCANCASKIEKKVSEINGVTSATVNFMNKVLTLEIDDISRLESIIKRAKDIIKQIEPGVEVIDKLKEKENIEKFRTKLIEIEEKNKKEIIRLVLGAVIYALAFAFKGNSAVQFAVFFVSYIIIGEEVLLKAVKNILKGQVFDENFLMAIATIGAFSIKQYPEGVAVMLFYQIGEFFQDIAVNRSRKSIASLMNIRPEFANLKTGDEIKKVPPEDVKIGDIIIVKPGEKIPLDGKVIEGRSMLDTSALTGESLPGEVEEGSDVLAGFINKNGLLTVEVTKEFQESAVAKILDLVQNAGRRKAPTENFITKFARYYTPIVVLTAAALAVLPPMFIPGAEFKVWMYRALIFLVISCPCALVISIPLSFFGGIGGASKKGILVKGSNYLEALNYVDTVVFDKTGTLTKGVFKVTKINSRHGISDDELLKYAAYAESYSNHPIALSIQSAYGKEINKNDIEKYDEISGYGIKARIWDKEIFAGNAKLMDKEGIEYTKPDEIGTVVHVAVDKNYKGYIVISDEVKEDSGDTVRALKEMGIKKVVMLTGDSRDAAEKVGRMLRIDEIYSELLPDEKVEKLEELDRSKPLNSKLMFVGDGINDAPVLARADIGIAMGGLGSDAAIEASDVVIMTDQPSKVVTAIKAARKTKKIVWQNIIFAIGVKVGILILGTAGIATMWEAVFGDVGVALIAILNAMRVMNVDTI